MRCRLQLQGKRGRPEEPCLQPSCIAVPDCFEDLQKLSFFFSPPETDTSSQQQFCKRFCAVQRCQVKQSRAVLKLSTLPPREAVQALEGILAAACTPNRISLHQKEPPLVLSVSRSTDHNSETWHCNSRCYPALLQN